jgi:excinuclease UvrABC ATPase subunit
MAEHLTVRGAREHNLRDVTVSIPKRQLTVVTGVSGSGKSSLVFDTIAAESQRQLNETFPAYVRNRLPHYGQPKVDSFENLSAAIVVDQKQLGGTSRSTVGTATDIQPLLRLLWSRAGQPFVGYSNAFSFNDPEGMCPRCEGIGRVRTIDLSQLVDERLSLNNGAITFPTFHVGGWTWRTFAESGHFDTDKPIADFDDNERKALLYGVPDKLEGVVTRFERIWLPKDVENLKGNTREAFERVVTQGRCPLCEGARLSQKTLSCLVNGRDIAECSAMEVETLVDVVRAVDSRGSAPVVASVVAHLERLVDIGLGYLTLDRPTSTLSGGESQRVKMVRNLGNSLIDLMYIFDEPTVGLHPHDVGQLTSLLHGLRDKGNTVLVVEHDPDVIAAADHVIDIGPGAGQNGGEIVFAGPPSELDNTATGRQLHRRRQLKTDVREPTGTIEIRGADRHNLRDVDVDIPTGVMTVVTGVAGSGKSSLIRGYLTDAIIVDQAAIRGSRRSNLATYTGILDSIRSLFAAENGVSAGLFSSNSEGGCPTCHGLGVVYTDLTFMDTVASVCEQCNGRRFTPEALKHKLRGLSIADVFDLSVRDADKIFPEPAIKRVLDRLTEVGLPYLSLGQTLNTLSGGERQRLKLADELDRTGQVYVFDEPTTGLHMSDVANLLALLDRLVSGGSTVIVIEHNLDVITQADWIIDLGPGPGHHGGNIVFEGTPTDLLKSTTSVTAPHLAAYTTP